MMSFACKMAWRETRAAWRHFLYFVMSVAIGVGALVGVALFGTNVERAVTTEARSLLGGDLEIQLSHTISPTGRTVLDSLKDRDMTSTHISELVAMAARITRAPTGGAPTQLVELKAVDALYPLYGSLRLEPPGTLWEMLGENFRQCQERACFGAVVQETLLIRMRMAVGDRLRIGEAEFVITGVVRTEPDRTASAFSLGPRVLISQQGLQASGLVKLGSRIRERYLLKIPGATPLDTLVYELRSRLAEDSARVSSYREAQPQLRNFLEELTRYLGLIGLTALFVGGLGVAVSVHSFVREKLYTIAILKSIGAEANTIVGTYVLQAVLLGLIGSLIGLILGMMLQRGLPWLVAGLLATDLLSQVGFSAGVAASSLIALGKGLVLGLLSTLLFALWPLLAIRDTKPAMVFRRDVLSGQWVTSSYPGELKPRGAVDPVRISCSMIIGLGLAGLSIWQAESWKIGLMFIGALVSTVLVLGLAIRAVLWLLKRWPRCGGLAVRQAIGNIVRPGSQAVSVTVAIGIAVMVIVTASLVEQAILIQVRDKRPDDAPTFFFIDIQPDQAEEFVRLLARQPGGLVPDLIPIVRSRLWALNGQLVKLDGNSEEDNRQGKIAGKEERRRRWYLSREYVVTFLDKLPKDNEVVMGAWWNSSRLPSKPLISIEEDAARHLGLTVGGTVELDIQGKRVVGEVSSIRKVDWSNFSTNFYLIFSPGSLDGTPITYVATARVPVSREVSLQEAVVGAFPNVTAINVRDVVESFSRLLDQLSLAIRAVALFCVFSGALVMAAALAATRYRRLYESVILKSLGATRGLLTRTFAVEYAILGAVGGGGGAVLASALSWMVLENVFDLSWHLQPWTLVSACMASIGLAMGVGFLSTFRILGQAPLTVLRHE